MVVVSSCDVSESLNMPKELPLTQHLQIYVVADLTLAIIEATYPTRCQRGQGE